MKSVMIDMDDVITCDNFIKIIGEYLGCKVGYEEIKSYYIQDILGDKKEDFFERFKDINLYENAVLEPDCYNVIKELTEKYKVYICTDYIWPEIIEYSGNNLKNKFEFLYQNFDFLSPKNYIFAADKSIVNCDIKIDDKFSNLQGASTKLLYTAYHNKNCDEDTLAKDNIVRVNSWKEIRDILL